MSAWVWSFAALSTWLAWAGDLERSLVTAVLALVFATLRLRPGWLGREWRKHLDDAERDSLYRGE